MRTPTIHLNGTHRDTLLDEVNAATACVREAIEWLAQVTVSERDYYPQGPDAYTDARAEMDARLATLRSTLAELDEMAIAIADA